MVYKGHIENGVVLLDESVDLPEGTVVHVEVRLAGDAAEPEMAPTLAERLSAVDGMVEGLPEDAAENVDHYLYGLAKRS